MNGDRFIYRVELSPENTRSVIRRARRFEGGGEPIGPQVREIIQQVRQRGDRALADLTFRFEQARLQPDQLRVVPDEIKQARKKVSSSVRAALESMRKNLLAVEGKRLAALRGKIISPSGVTIRTDYRPLASVGCYVPGGRAIYPSSLVMSVTAARAAGVPRVIICSPPAADGSIHPLILVAADLCGTDEIFKVGGAQAIAAMAYGTASIERVDKIVGPGNAFVAEAKLYVSRRVLIDSPAGPSELLVIADTSANPKFVALDLVSQAEHGTDSVCGLVTPSKKLADAVDRQLAEILERTPRKEIAGRCLRERGFIAVCGKLDEAIAFVNTFAPEHLEIMTKQADRVVQKIISAGLILVGDYSPVAASDYFVGTNHVLPTGGHARSYSGLSSLDFVKRMNVVQCGKQHLKRMVKPMQDLAVAEGLPNHFLAIARRLDVKGL